MVIAILRDNIRSDLLRYTGKIGLLSFLRAFWKYPGFRYSFYHRHCYYYQSQNSLNYKVRFTFYYFFLNLIGKQYGYNIHYENRFGKGLRLPEAGPINIGSWVIFGHNVNLSPGLVIKVSKNADREVPVYGNMICIGENVILDGVNSIGNNVVIDHNTRVLSDIPDNSMVSGDPALVTPLRDGENSIDRAVDPHKTKTRLK